MESSKSPRRIPALRRREPDSFPFFVVIVVFCGALQLGVFGGSCGIFPGDIPATAPDPKRLPDAVAQGENRFAHYLSIQDRRNWRLHTTIRA